MPDSRISGYIFDLDGTLVDSFDDLTSAINEVRHDLGLFDLGRDDVMKNVGHGVHYMVESSIPPQETVSLDDLVARFRKAYSSGCLGQTKPYAGVPEELERLHKVFPMAVLSNKPEAETRLIIEGLGLAGFFVAVYGGDSFVTRKPEPDGLLATIKEMGIEPAGAVMVGDSDIDIAAGKAAGVMTVLVRTGLYKTAVLKSDRVIDGLGELSSKT